MKWARFSPTDSEGRSNNSADLQSAGDIISISFTHFKLGNYRIVHIYNVFPHKPNEYIHINKVSFITYMIWSLGIYIQNLFLKN